RDSAVGQRSSQRRYRGMMRSTCVCWSMTSLTRIAYGSRVRRQGRSRPSSAYQSRSARSRSAIEPGFLEVEVADDAAHENIVGAPLGARHEAAQAGIADAPLAAQVEARVPLGGKQLAKEPLVVEGAILDLAVRL